MARGLHLIALRIGELEIIRNLRHGEDAAVDEGLELFRGRADARQIVDAVVRHAGVDVGERRALAAAAFVDAGAGRRRKGPELDEVVGGIHLHRNGIEERRHAAGEILAREEAAEIERAVGDVAGIEPDQMQAAERNAVSAQHERLEGEVVRVEVVLRVALLAAGRGFHLVKVIGGAVPDQDIAGRRITVGLEHRLVEDVRALRDKLRGADRITAPDQDAAGEHLPRPHVDVVADPDNRLLENRQRLGAVDLGLVHLHPGVVGALAIDEIVRLAEPHALSPP